MAGAPEKLQRRPRRRALATVAGFLAAAALLAPETPRATGDETPPAVVAGSDVAWRLFFTGDTRGYLHPCGCERGLFGGLPRRATFLAQARREEDLLIDLGNIVVGKRPHDRVRLKYVLEGLAKLEYDLLVPGEGELLLGEEFERVALELERPRVICANLVNAETGERVYRPWAIHRTATGKRIAVVGLTSQYQRLPAKYEVAPPADALRNAVRELEGKTDSVIAAGYLKGKPALDLARAFPELRLVAGSFVPAGSPALLSRGGAPVMLGGERGQYVAWVAFDPEDRAIRGGQAWLHERVRDDRELRALVDRHDREVSELGTAFAAAKLASFRDAGWVGSESCKECHKSEYEVWTHSKHAHAMERLAEKGQANNPNCLQCHLEDLAAPDAVRGIGCESCHGGGREHVAAARSGSPPRSSRMTEDLARHPRNQCAGCHDKENSPQFGLAEYWKRIKHGKDEHASD